MTTFGYVQGAFRKFRNVMEEITVPSEVPHDGETPYIFAFEFSWLSAVVYNQRSRLSDNPGSRMR